MVVHPVPGAEYAPAGHRLEFPFGCAAEEDAYVRPNHRRDVSLDHAVLYREEHERRHRQTAVEITRRQFEGGATASNNIRKDAPSRYNLLCFNPPEEFLIAILVKRTSGLVISPRAVVSRPPLETVRSPLPGPRHQEPPATGAQRREIAYRPGARGVADHHHTTAK